MKSVDRKENSLAIKNPELAKQWHPTKNGDLTPDDVTTGSGKKVWWICEKGHEWEAAIYSRASGNNCPYCAGQRVCVDNCLQTLYPELAKQWHPTKNEDLTPKDITIKSEKKAWWICDKGHPPYIAAVSDRTSGTGCPYCVGKRVCIDNCLQTLYPELAKQWHPTKNGNLTPNDVTEGSGKKAWWICEKGHEWKAVIGSRTKGVGCPICNMETNTSFPEQALYFYISQAYSDTLNRYMLDKLEIDVFIPSLKLCIEYDGIYYHRNKEKTERKKDKHIEDNGLFLLRVKETEEKTPNCYQRDNIIYCNKLPTPLQINGFIKAVFEFIGTNITGKTYEIDIDVKRDRAKIYELFLTSEKKKSMSALYPEISKQWHPTLNGNITPDMVKAKSGKKFYWLCEQGHEWEDTVISRTRENCGCPYCSGHRVCTDNCLQTLNPELAEQWHPTKNGDLTPTDVTLKSSKKVWWICEKGHSYEATVQNKSNERGCPYCAGKRVCADNCLQTLFPKLAKQWHPVKNGDLTPFDVTHGMVKKFWWKCEKGHEWLASPNGRTKSKDCPFCLGKRVCSDNCLQTLDPNLSKQWHPTKNGDLTPTDVTLKSSKKVWWICEKEHEWEAAVCDRSNGNGCPYCAGKRACLDNCLQTLFPELAKQWHPTKNGDLTPNEVTRGSNKKVWWICEMNSKHEWKAIIISRVRGNGCPYCAGKRK